jgi:hypothetical protein
MLETLQREFPHAEGVAFTQALKQSLIENLALMLEGGRLQLLPDPELLRELYHFEATPTARGVQLQGAAGVHDDLVIALALAAWTLPAASDRRNPHQRRSAKTVIFAKCDSNHRLPLRAGGNLLPR